MEQIKPTADSEQAWTKFEGALAAVLSDLAEDQFLIVARKQTDYFVQFAAQGAFGMRIEAVSNTYIKAPALLSPEASQWLIDQGWHAPTYAPGDFDVEPADGSPNFYLDAAAPVPFRTVAHFAVGALRAAYRVRHPAELQYSAIDAGGNPLRFPALKIKEEGA